MATYYWVGGSGTWDDTNTANWSSSSGGSGGAGKPTSSDSAFFDANSGVSPAITIASTATCSLFIVFSGASTAFTLSGNVTFPSSTAVFLRGSLNLDNYIFSAGDLNFATSPAASISFGTSGRMEIASIPGSLSMQDATGFSYTGTFDIRFTSSPSGSSIREVSLGTLASGYWTESTVIDIGASKVPGISLGTTATNFLSVAGYFKTVDFTGVGGSSSAGSGAIYVYGDLTFDVGHVGAGVTYYLYKSSGTQVLTGGSGNTIAANIYTENSSSRVLQLNGDFTMQSGFFIAAFAGTLDLNGATLSTPALSMIGLGSNSTLSFNGGSVVLPYEASQFTTSNNVNFTGTFDISMTYIGSSGSRVIDLRATSFTEANSLSFGTGAATNTIFIDSSATDEILVYGKVKNIDLTSYAGTLNIPPPDLKVYGNLTTSASTNITSNPASSYIFEATSGVQTIDTNGAAINASITVGGPLASTATVSFANATTMTSLTFIRGTLELPSGQTTSVGSFVTSGATLKYLVASSVGVQSTLSDSSGTNTATYLSIKDNLATGGAIWTATSNTNVNAGNVSGWNFGVSPNSFFLF
jgi:hypothetical protein